MALSDFVKTAVHGSFVLSDGTGTPVTLTGQYDLGDVAISGLSGPFLNEVVDFETRGNYLSSAHGARRYPQITFSGYLTGESASGTGSLESYLMRAAPYGSNVSVLGSGRVYAINFTLNIRGTDFGDDGNWSTTFAKCVPTDTNFGEAMDGDKFSFTLSCKGAVTGSLVASEI